MWSLQTRWAARAEIPETQQIPSSEIARRFWRRARTGQYPDPTPHRALQSAVKSDGVRRMSGWRARIDLREFVAGAIFMLVAAAFALSALRNLSLGTAGKMGPGYFPLMVAAALAMIGLVISLRAVAGRTETINVVGWRGFVLVLAAPAAFALTVSPLGFVAAIVCATAIAAWASSVMTVRFSLGLVLFMTTLCVVVFSFVLKMPVPLFGAWIRWKF